MTDKQKVKEFLVALSKGDYVNANKVFPEVVDSSIQKIINNRKEDVINDINVKASEIAMANKSDQTEPDGEE